MKPRNMQSHDEQQWHKLQFLLKVAKLQWQERDYLNSIPEVAVLKMGLRREDVRSDIKSIRNALRSPWKPKKLDTFRWKTRDRIRQLLGIGVTRKARNEAFIEFGKVDVRIDQHKASHDLFITVGPMWSIKVWNRFYAEGGYEQKDSHLILQADEVRVNDRNLRLFEAVVMNIDTKKMMSGWLCQARMEKPRTVFATTANAAIKRVQGIISTQIDNTLKGMSANERRENS